jgi:hypothetical protein
VVVRLAWAVVILASLVAPGQTGGQSAGAAAQDGAQPAKQPAPAPPADFKLKIALYSVGPEPVETAELFCRAGKLYQFRSGSSEALMIDVHEERIDLIDFAPQRRMRTSVTFAKLDEAVAKLRQALADAALRREQEGGKANAVAAAMTRSLIEPKLSANFDATAGRLRLAGENAEVTATGTPEADTERLALLDKTLPALTRLEWIRLPEDVPPFTRLSAFQTLMQEHRMRPLEITVIYRLAAQPQKLRVTYELALNLKPSETEALARIDAFRPRATYLGFARYEKVGKH